MSDVTNGREPVQPDPSAREPRIERDARTVRDVRTAPAAAGAGTAPAAPATTPAGLGTSAPTRPDGDRHDSDRHDSDRHDSDRHDSDRHDSAPGSPSARPEAARGADPRAVDLRGAHVSTPTGTATPTAGTGTGTATPTAGTGTGTVHSEHTAEWSRLQAQFVDDPAAAVKGASTLVEQAVQRLLGSSGRQDTEELRTAFLRYRELHRTLTP